MATLTVSGLALGKELVADSLTGKGPSIRDAAEDGLGIATGYATYKLSRKGIGILPFHKGARFSLEF